MQKIVHIVGPTGVGKTALALRLAKKNDASLVSADSVQVYKGLDIISGKDIPNGSKFHLLKKVSDKFDFGFYDFSGTKIYLLDVVDPFSSFSVYDFLKVSEIAVAQVLKENKLPIIVGGTGLYVEKLITGLDLQDSKINPKHRKKFQEMTVLKLQEMLGKLNPEKFKNLNNSDANNPRRLIRCIEIEKMKNRKSRIMNHEKQYNSLVIGLQCERSLLKKRIDKRVDERLKNGAKSEAENLFRNYDNLSSPIKNANGYKQLFKYLNKEITFDEALYRWKISEYRHAKNQMTWFKKYGNTKWYDISKKSFESDIEHEISSFLT